MMTLNSIISVMREKGYKIQERPSELNIVGIRINSTTPNRFDDTLAVFYKVKNGTWALHTWSITTDPGTYWLRNPMKPKGTAILKAGQYPGSHAIGLHQGKYKALRQVRPVTVIRDYDRDAELDYKNGREEKGIFYINIHRASANGTTLSVDRYSAGCQVFANINDFNTFMQLAERHRQLYGNSFTYTLIDERAEHREKVFEAKKKSGA